MAVGGASPKPGSFGGAVVRNLARHFNGDIYPVNPQYAEVEGKRCFPSLVALPATPDCLGIAVAAGLVPGVLADAASARSEEHTSELQSLMRISYAVFCLKKKNNKQH